MAWVLVGFIWSRHLAHHDRREVIAVARAVLIWRIVLAVHRSAVSSAY